MEEGENLARTIPTSNPDPLGKKKGKKNTHTHTAATHTHTHKPCATMTHTHTNVQYMNLRQFKHGAPRGQAAQV